MPATYPESLPVLLATSLLWEYWGPFSTDADTRYYFGLRDPDGFITVIKSTDKGDTWTEMDAAGAKEPFFLQSFCIVPHPNFPVNPVLYVLYLNVVDEFLHVVEFDTSTDLWATEWASAVGFNDLAAAPQDVSNSWYGAFRPDSTTIMTIFGAFNAEIVDGDYWWRVGYMRFDTFTGLFTAYTDLFSPAGVKTNWLTAGAAPGNGTLTHLVYTQNDGTGTDQLLRQATLTGGGVVHPSQTIHTIEPPDGISVFEWINTVKSRELSPGVVEIYFAHNRGTLNGTTENYVVSMARALSEDEPTWTLLDVKSIAYSTATGTGILIGQKLSFEDSTGVTLFWVQEQWSSFVLVNTRLVRVKITGTTISTEETVFNSVPAGYTGAQTGSAGLLFSGTDYGVALTLFDSMGVGPLLNYYWEFVDTPLPPAVVSSPVVGSGGGGWWTFPQSIGQGRDDVRKFKTPVREANIYDCCLRKFAGFIAGRNIEYKIPCEMDHSPHGYTFPKLGREFWERGAIPTPEIVDGDVVVAGFEVPLGYDGVIYGVACNYSGAGFTDGAGDIEWRLQVGPVYARDFGQVVYQLGAPEQPLQLSDHIRLRSGQRVRWIVRVLGAGIVSGTTLITCSAQGWFYPQGRRS